jgi:hypothetical protein
MYFLKIFGRTFWELNSNFTLSFEEEDRSQEAEYRRKRESRKHPCGIETTTAFYGQAKVE